MVKIAEAVTLTEYGLLRSICLMVKGSLHATSALILGFLSVGVSLAHGSNNVSWESTLGFDPNSIIVSPGDTVYFSDIDLHGFSVTITISGMSSFSLSPYHSRAVTFPTIGTFSIASNFGDVAQVMVQPPPIALSNPRLSGNQFLFDVTGLSAGKTNVVLYCTNVSSGVWVPLLTNTATASSQTLTNPLVLSRRFYRLYQIP